MTDEEKQLLLQDLCARLPYGVVYHRNDDANIKLNAIDVERGLLNYTDDIDERECKPYLRPMESMTEEELDELSSFGSGVVVRKDVLRNLVLDVWYNTSAIDWLNKNMFDYRGLIPKGLALPARIMEICTKGLVGNYKKSNRYISCNKEGMYNKKEE